MKKVSKKIICILSFIIMVIVSLFFLNKKEEKVLTTKKENKSSFLSMMIEQEDGTYKENTNINFVKEGYLFNPQKSGCENGGSISWNEKYEKVETSLLTSDKCYAYFDIYTLNKYCEFNKENTLVCELVKKKDNNLIYHDENLTGGAEDYSYRYAGSSEEVNNFVCLDGGVTTKGQCANGDADLYRIIGLFKNLQGDYEAKLIKYDYATVTEVGSEGANNWVYTYTSSNYVGNPDNLAQIGGYFWTSSENQVNEWAESTLRETNLNDYYLNTYLKTTKGIDTDKLIASHIWSLNGHNSWKITPKEMYDYEIGKVEDSTEYSTVTKMKEDKIGLMYASDYGYAIKPGDISDWNISLEKYSNYISKNWLYRGLTEWFISRNSATSANALAILNSGAVDDGFIYNRALAIRPSFYITSSVKIASGDGSKDSPYRLVF